MITASTITQSGCGGEVGLALTLLAIIRLAVLGLDTVVVAALAIATALFDERLAYHVARLWVRVNLFVCGVRVSVRRCAPLDASAAYVFMSNHRSQYDILALVEALEEFQLRWVAKKELTRVPFFGWALKHTGHIIIDRSDHEQAVASLRAARAKMEDGVSVVIFPEGTRSASHQTLLPFKKGGFMLALETGFPIVPIVVRGSRQILPRGSWQASSGTIDVVVGPPIPVAGASREELMERVWRFMLDHLDDASDMRPSAVAAL